MAKPTYDRFVGVHCSLCASPVFFEWLPVGMHPMPYPDGIRVELTCSRCMKVDYYAAHEFDVFESGDWLDELE